MAVKIQIRRDSAANWVTANPVLASGEFGFETNTGNIKVGDGSTVWTALAYIVEAHTRSHTMTSISDHTAGNHKVFYSNAAGQVVELALGANGTVLTAKGIVAAPEFTAPSGGTFIADADGDTKIQCEEVADEDYIRLDTGGIERIMITSGDGSGVYFTPPDTSSIGVYVIHPNATWARAFCGKATHISLNHGLNRGGILSLYAEREASSEYNFAVMAYSTTGGADGDVKFKFRGDGNAYADGTWGTPASDYAEYFESIDGTAIPYGTTVVLVGEKVRPALVDEVPVGIIRPKDASGVVGNNAWSMWKEKYLRNDYGGHIFEDYQVCTFTYTDEEGKEKIFSNDIEKLPEGLTIPEGTEIITQQRHKLNPDYDPTLEYIPREEREEWNSVGLVGRIPITKGQPVDSRWVKMCDVSETVELWLVK